MANKNPWRGLLSYQDPVKSKANHIFCGREKAISSLFAMIDNNLLVTMYGKTGIGKTSVLNAGVFPLLRSCHYLPISIRLGKYENMHITSFAKCIVDEIIAEIKSLGGKIETIYPNHASENSLSVDFLWKFFLTSRFENKEGEEIYPVIALDQFEEIFISNPKEATLLMKQINALLDDNRELLDMEGCCDSTNFRFIFAIREDDLFYLEDCIDANYLSDMKQNRYRLCPLTDEEARDVVLLGKDMMEDDTEEEIAKRIVNLAKEENGNISTNLLSLICTQLFIKSEGNFTLDIVNSFSKNPLESFYTNCMSRVSPKTRTYIEDQLVDQDRRKFVRKKDLQQNISSKDLLTLTTGEFRIFQYITAGNTECVELIHDSLARTIFYMKKDTAERLAAQKLIRHTKWIRIGLCVLSAFLLIALCVIGYLYLRNKKMQQINSNRQHHFTINIVEDSTVVADNDFWKANLLVIAETKTKLDTLCARKLNKATKDEPIELQVDSANAVRIIMNYSDLKHSNRHSSYNQIDTTLTVMHLTNHPSVKLFVQKKQPKLHTYSSKVVMNLTGKDIDIQDAIVILRDKIQRTDKEGYFTFNLRDTLRSNDLIYIVKRGYNCYEESNIVVSGQIKDKFIITPSDSLTAFEEKCNQIDNTDHGMWKYQTVSDKRLNGEKATYKGASDRIIFYATTEGRTRDGKFKIRGYYYSLNEYNAYQKTGNPHYAYHIFKGSMDSQNLKTTKAPYKNFEVHSHDVAGNRQTIHGHFMSSGRLFGKIMVGDETVGIFGDYKEE